jgi:hypothetical protein
MQPAVEAPGLVVGGLVDPVGMVAIVGWLGIALLLTWLSRRVARAPGLEHWDRWLHLAVIFAWLAATIVLGRGLLAVNDPLRAATRLLPLLVVAIVAAPTLRDVVAGVVLRLEGRHQAGDDVRVLEFEGRIATLGLRSVLLRRDDGSECTIPNRRFTASPVVRLNLSTAGAPIEIDVVLHRAAGPEAAVREVLEAAVLCPLAAPGSRPEVFVVETEGDRVVLKLRAYVFDRAEQARYRSAILTRLAGAPDVLRRRHPPNTIGTNNHHADPAPPGEDEAHAQPPSSPSPSPAAELAPVLPSPAAAVPSPPAPGGIPVSATPPPPPSLLLPAGAPPVLPSAAPESVAPSPVPVSPPAPVGVGGS